MMIRPLIDEEPHNVLMSLSRGPYQGCRFKLIMTIDIHPLVNKKPCYGLVSVRRGL